MTLTVLKEGSKKKIKVAYCCSPDFSDFLVDEDNGHPRKRSSRRKRR